MYIGKSLGLIFAFSILLSLTGCDLFNPKAENPAVIQIDKFIINADSLTQGTNAQKITDAWIYLNDNLQGVYELPAKFPVIADGTYNLKVYPGIKVNGISGSRAAYTFLNYYEDKNFSLSKEKTNSITGTSSYKSYLTFTWLENFESQGITLIRGVTSDTGFQVVAGGSESFNNTRFGAVYLDGSKTNFLVTSYQGFKLPNDGTRASFLELHYATTGEMIVGIIANQTGATATLPLITLNSTGGAWNKIYLNFSDLINSNRLAKDYSIYFAGKRKIEDSPTRYFFENIKLIHE